ncbi:riboflavin kinase [Xylariaceae sp. AK1471]|nr:riboflavin kinase [Xylariaceae sp. AK1471]
MTETTTTTTEPRPRILYPDSGPEPPYPLRMEGTVISGFGRGSKELGIPTANLPVDAATTPWIADARSGVYFGWASLALPAPHPDSATASSSPPNSNNNNNNTNGTPSSPQTDATQTQFQIYPMVMSIGYNPFYKNSVRSAEVHVLHSFGADFYDAPMRLLILGFVRDERDYSGLDALVEDIRIDCDVARQSLSREAWTPAQGVVGGARGTFDGAWLVRRGEE